MHLSKIMFGISSIRFHGLWYSISSVSTKTVLGIPSPFLPFPQKRSWVIHLHILVHLFPGKSFFPFITIVVKFNMHPHFYTEWLFFVRLFKLFSVPGPSVPTKTQKRSWVFSSSKSERHCILLQLLGYIRFHEYQKWSWVFCHVLTPGPSFSVEVGFFHTSRYDP